MTDATAQLDGKTVIINFGENTSIAVDAAQRAESAAIAAQAAAGLNEYASTAAGLAGTTVGELFWVDNAAGIGIVYRHDAGPVATEIRRFIIDPEGTSAASLIGADDDAAGTLWATIAGFITYLRSSAGGAIVGTQTGSTVQTDITDIRTDFTALEVDLGAIAAQSPSYDGTSPLAVVASDDISNKADPNIADVGAAGDAAPAIGTTTANQLWRLHNNTTGLLSAQSAATLGAFAVTRKYDVTAGTTYTFHLYNCAPGWTIYSVTLARIQFFNTDGSFHSELTSGYTADSFARFVTFTVPAGAEKVAFNIRDAVNYSNTNALTEAALQAAINNAMLVVGAVIVPYVPFDNDPFTMVEARFDAGQEGDLKVTVQDEFTYIRSACQIHATKDIIWRFRADYGVHYYRTDNRTGIVDPWGARFVLKSNQGALPSSFNLSADVHCAGFDEGCPERRNQMFVDGNHGSTCYKVTKNAHGMTNVDVGSIWTDGSSNWLLLFIHDANTLVFQRRYTGTNTKWSISSTAPSSSTFTHVSGATHTGNIAFTAPTLSQFVPIINEYVTRLMVDGVKIIADGDYAGDAVWIDEGYIGLNLAKVQDALIAAVGTGTPNWTPDVPQVRRYNRYEFSKYGSWTLYGAHFTVDAYSRVSADDYFGGIQLQRLSLTSDTTPGMHNAVELFIPDVGTVSGMTFKDKADITLNTTSVDIRASNCDDPLAPSSLFCLLGKSGGAYVSGHVYGFDPSIGIAQPSSRTADCDYIFNLSTANKNYPKLIDYLAGDAAADDVFEFAAFRAPFLADQDSDLTIPGVIYYAKGKIRCVVATHQALTQKHVQVPVDFSGFPVSILTVDGKTMGSGFTLTDDFVRNGAVVLSSSGYAWAVLEIG